MIFLICSFLASCKKEEPYPELFDPIYRDLTTLFKNEEKKLTDLLKEREENNKELQLAGANPIDLKVVRKKILHTEDQIVQTKQNIEYSRIRMERRRIESRISYHKAFEAGSNWPDSKEYEAYLTNKRLKNPAKILEKDAKPKKKEAKAEPSESKE